MGRGRLVAVAVVSGGLLAGTIPAVSALWAVALSQVQPLFNTYFDGIIAVSRPSMIADPAAFRSFRTAMDFPLTEDTETLVRGAAIQVGVEGASFLSMLFPSWGLDRVRLDTSVSDAVVILRRRAAPSPVTRGIFSPLEPPDPDPAWDFRTDIYNTTIYFFPYFIQEAQAKIARPWLRIEKARMDTIHGITSVQGEGYATMPLAYRVEMPIRFIVKQSAYDRRRFYLRIDSQFGTLSGDWFIGRNPAYVMRYHVNDARALCFYMLSKETCGAVNYKASLDGSGSADAAFKRTVFDSHYDFTLPLADRPIGQMHFAGRARGTYDWDAQRIDVDAMDGDGNMGRIAFNGDVLVRENRYRGHFEYRTEDLNVINLLSVSGNAAIPPGGATFAAEVDVPYSDMRTWKFDGDFRFLGYRMNQVEQGRSFMRWLKITEDGADDDEMVFPKTQGIGLEIKKGSGGRVSMREGRVSSPLFAINTETMIARFSGRVNIVDARYDMYMKFQGLKQVDRFIARVPIINSIVNRGPDSSILDLNFQITGPLKAPLFKPVYNIPDAGSP